MGWFDEQLRQRIRHDDDVFSDAFVGMASVVMGEKITDALSYDRIQAKNAIDEMLVFYHVKPRELPDNIEDFNEKLEYLMRPSGIMRRMVELKGEWYRDAVGAMIGVRKDDGTAVALIPGAVSGYTFFDAKKGKRVKINRKTAELLDSEAMCFYKPLPMKKIGIPDLLIYIAQTMAVSDFIAIGLATLAVTLIGFLIPGIQQMIYRYVIPGGSMQLLFAVFGFMLCVVLSQMLMDLVKEMLMARLQTKMNIAVQAAGMARMLSLPAGFFKKYSSGELTSRMGTLNNLCTMLANALLTTGLTSVFSLAYITQMVKYGPGLVVPGLFVILVSVAFSAVTTLVEMRISRRSMELGAREYGMTYALISGVQKIKLSGAEKRAFAQWAKSYQANAKLIYDPPALIKFSGVISTGISLAGTIVIYYFAIQTRVSLADYYAFNASYGMVMGAFASLLGMAAVFAQIKPTLEMARPLLEAVPEMAENKKVVTRLSGGIELNNVSFRYSESAPPVIDNLTLKIRPGQYVAIVGATGCGKSTLMRLMLGFETPQKGSVYFDGKDLSSLDLKSLRRKIGTVMQDGKLFQGDIFSNIIISAPQLSMDAAWEAAEMAGIAEDIRHMPMGMHTIISEGSGGVSGGQRQRLMIARAIAPKPRILMFDEATSALDNMTQKTVSDSLEKLKCTRIVIAHRLSTIRHCDRILVLDNGKIAEDGTYEELTAKNGIFARLVERQRLDTTDAS